VPDPDYHTSVKAWVSMYHQLGFTDGFADQPTNNFGIAVPYARAVKAFFASLLTSVSY
jgi:hypothetical protein